MAWPISSRLVRDMQADDDEQVTVFLKKPRFDSDGKPIENLTMTGKLTCLNSELLESQPAGSVHWLIRDEEIVGRGEDCTIVINSPELSRRHARFNAYSHQWIVEDCDSRNGVWLNDARVELRQTVSSGDTIRFGRIAFRFEVFPMTASEVAEQISGSQETTPVDPDQFLQDTVAVDLSNPDNDFKSKHRKLKAQADAFGVNQASDDRLASSLESLRNELPGIIEQLTEKARNGDVEAARVCIDIVARAEILKRNVSKD